MGRGDKRSRRGKIFKGSYGNTRKHRKAAKTRPAGKTSAPAAPKKAPAKKAK